MKIPALSILALLSLTPLSIAQRPSAPATPPEPAPLRQGTLSFYFENDLFAGTDRYYTSGVKLGWTSSDLEKFGDSPYASPLLPILDRLPFVNNPDYQKNLAFSLGQNIYTPDDTESFEPVDGERPYAGWLYVGVGLIWKNAQVRNSLVLNIGVVGGSWSLGDQAQTAVHEVRNLDTPNGWGNQLHNELGVQAVYERTWRWPHKERRAGFDWELLPHAGAGLGNVRIFANLGGEARFGVNLPDDFGSGIIGPAAVTPSPVEGAQQADRTRKFDLGMYVFARAEGRAVAHNVFLAGNTFGNSVSVGHRPLVADVSVGAAFNYKNTKLTYALVYRTKEFYGQEEAQLFGAISLNMAF